MSSDSHPVVAGVRENHSVSRFLLSAAFALWALTGPAWLGSVGVAQAGFRPTGIGGQDVFPTGATAPNGASSQDPSPHSVPPHRSVPQLGDLPAQHGSTSTGSTSAPAG